MDATPRAWLLLALLGFACWPLLSQSSSTPQASDILPSQKIGPGDLLSISVSDCPEMTRNFRVSTDGTLTLPLLQQKIRAAAKVPEEIETEIQQALIQDQLLVHPVVSVAALEYRSVPIRVFGAVRRPITFQAVGFVTLLDAITRADGLTSDAGNEILIARSVFGANSAPALQHIPIQLLFAGTDPLVNVRLYGGEEIRVTFAARVHVLGAVQKVGPVPLSSQDSSLTNAIAISGGFLSSVAHQIFVYRRKPGAALRQELVFNLNKDLHLQIADFQLMADDIVYAPDRRGKRLDVAALERLTGAASPTVH